MFSSTLWIHFLLHLTGFRYKASAMETYHPNTPVMGDVLREYGLEFMRENRLSEVQHKAFYALRNCRTPLMGGHVQRCEQCSYSRVFYHSCRNRHCPQCQGLRQHRWVEKLSCDLLQVPYFHVVFTLPSELNDLASENQKAVYPVLFRAAWESVQTLSKDRRYLNGSTGMLAILHTWGQNLMFHPHLHTMIPSGSWNPAQNRWNPSGKKFFLPVKALSVIFRNKFLYLLRQARKDHQLIYKGRAAALKNNASFKTFTNQLYNKRWVVYTKKSFKNSSHILRYLGRYSHRVALSNNRIRSISDDGISFTMKDYRDGKRKQMTLQPKEFIRRFFLHILPHGFFKIRYFGIFACRNRRTVLAACKTAMNQNTVSSRFTGLPWQQQLLMVTGRNVLLCPVCETASMSHISFFKGFG